tara:strand:+ start:585 stop:728 length:144 start_codon:yes stop_codon:yes gene_type:complete
MKYVIASLLAIERFIVSITAETTSRELNIEYSLLGAAAAEILQIELE